MQRTLICQVHGQQYGRLRFQHEYLWEPQFNQIFLVGIWEHEGEDSVHKEYVIRVGHGGAHYDITLMSLQQGMAGHTMALALGR